MSTPEIAALALVLFDAAHEFPPAARGSWSDAPESVRAFYRRLARAAIAALRSETT